MTIDVFASDGPSRRPSDGRTGALAVVTPIAMFLLPFGASSMFTFLVLRRALDR